MFFHHADEIWEKFPSLRAAAIVVRGVSGAKKEAVDIDAMLADTAGRLRTAPESEWPSIQAWRQAYAAMGFKPTQYRCAAEALLRRYRKDGALPRFHPLVDVLNAESMNAGIPIAAFDVAHIADGITVRAAVGDEVHTTFKGESEHPVPGEIVFADAAGQAHSRRWVYRQGAASVVRDRSDVVLIVAEALHEDAMADVTALCARLRDRASELGLSVTEETLLTPENRQLEFAPAGVTV
ncbi:B3/B4 domain-containing protein [Roseibium marinum]|uniref:DNA/RNA-binding domain of Phe-tRNA-synthetase-like protein n=1 Tax=Roseibium marinum TaxID=281252 RepID=A0A2S3V0Y9_9HYPH|nr:phenylalanine--tRNA ligase beta subunit-related protein [Roseibium marinum]POF33641.1 DNA/RNA-binding domain of Phe-tRNA-synthetase-like protein [Roseibium marinum]